MTWKNVPTRMIDVDGTPFAYRELGPEGGVPVVFLHHLMAVLDDWDPRVIDGIAAHHRVIAFDNRGVGRSGGKVPTDIDAMGSDAVAFIRAMGHEQVDLLGFSLGGGVAQMVLLQAPDLVRRAVLAGTGPKGGGGIDEITKVSVKAYLEAAVTLKDPRTYLFFPRNPAGKTAAKAYLRRLKERTDDRDKRISMQARRAQLKAIRAAGLATPDDLSVITQPVLLTTGAIIDPHMANLPLDFFGAAADATAALIPNAKRTTIEVAGHVADPALLGPILAAFYTA